MERIPNPDRRQHIPRFHDELMTVQEYAQIKHPRPYEYTLKADDRELAFFGPRHTNDPSDPIFEKIRQHLNTKKPDLVLVEGMEAINKLSPAQLKQLTDLTPETDAIKKHGENFFTTKLAIDQGIKVISPEPSDLSAIQYLEQQGLPRDAIFAQQVASIITQYARTQTKPDFETYVSRYLNRMSIQFSWNDFDFSLDHFKQIHLALFNVPFNLENTALYKAASDPIPWEGKPYGPTNQVAASWGQYRDRHIIDTIQDSLDTHKNIFIVYGASHAVIQEPALRKLMEYRANQQKK